MTADDVTRGGLTCDEVRDLAPGFVLGALEATEADAVRRHLADCPEAHAEVEELGGVVGHLLADVEPAEPPAGLRARILAAAAADAERPAAPVPAESRPPAAPEPIPFRRPDAPRRGTSAGAWVLRIAAVVAIVALGAWNVLLQGQLGRLESDQAGIAAVLDAAALPGSQLAILSGEGGVRGAAAVRSDGSVVLAVEGLAATTGSEVYETWLIPGDGTPVPVGGFEVGADGFATFETRSGPGEAGAIVALTLEPSPGATTPTLPIVASGVATAPPTG
jgi:anti-sigma-K factor RskA